MSHVLIAIHLMVVLAMIGVVLLQRSEGGALGIGGGGGGGGFMSARGAGNVLTRATAILAVAFFATSIGLTLVARYQAGPSGILDRIPVTGPAVPVGGSEETDGAPAAGGVLDAFRQGSGGNVDNAGPQAPAPADTAPAETAPVAPAPADAAPAAPAPEAATPQEPAASTAQAVPEASQPTPLVPPPATGGQ